jgi:hypothetical protein
MTLAELRKQLDKEREETANRPFVPPPPLPELALEHKQAARELMLGQIRHDAEVRYGPFVREQENAGATALPEPRLLEIQAAIASGMAATRERYRNFPMRSASAEEAYEYPYTPGWYDPVSVEVVVNDAAVERIGIVIAGMTGTEAAGKWAAAFLDEEFIHMLSDRVQRQNG